MHMNSCASCCTGSCAVCAYRFSTNSSTSTETTAGSSGKLHGGRFAELFATKPVLLRLLAGVTRQWLEASCEFLDRLDTDFPGATVTVLRGGLSDRHHGGRQAMLVGFDTGTTLIYKPKDLRADIAWHALVKRLNRRAPIRLRAAKAIAGAGYGWSEYVVHTGCRDITDFATYFFDGPVLG